ncbi:sugar ABC transporter substrate-binding protein [Streptomyces sp. NBC_00878]|uniref:sugar ABC transporter substrate-binding protein n=1 Tax=Streptomyces sp. NBC_00878 TaxID=2975854 RepID=UPI00225106E3|nr:sugar ABC transporter substrate-binding protein [Streptomyces sp. NBC_00878]MCX4908174.1 sugar ABC transporter substrate-binding protein [Streptomyces sp. NBC_00878]
MRIPSTRVPVAVLAVTGLFAGLTACGSGNDDSSNADAPLEVWTRSAPEPAATYKKVFAAFTKKTGIKVDYQPVIEFDKQLQARASSKDLPDVFINDASALGTYQSQGLLLPIDPASVAGGKSISPANWKYALGADGKTYGVPFSRQAFNTYIRKDWLKKLGLDVPQTWDDLTKVATAFATKDPDGNGKKDTYGMVVPGSTERGYLAWWAASYIWQGGGDFVKKTGQGKYESVIDSAGTAAAVKWVKTQFCTKGNVQPGALTSTTANAPHFHEGAAGISLTGPYMISGFDQQLGKEKYEIIPTPKGPAGSTTLSDGETIYLGAGSKKNDAQKKLAEFLITPQAQKIAMESVTQPVVRVPVNSSLDAAEVRGDDRWKAVQEQYDNDSRAFPQDIDFTAVKQTAAEGLNKIFADCGSDNIASGLQQLDKDITSELEAQDLT